MDAILELLRDSAWLRLSSRCLARRGVVGVASVLHRGDSRTAGPVAACVLGPALRSWSRLGRDRLRGGHAFMGGGVVMI